MFWINLGESNLFAGVIEEDSEVAEDIRPAEDIRAGIIIREEAADNQFMAAYLDANLSNPDAHSLASLNTKRTILWQRCQINTKPFRDAFGEHGNVSPCIEQEEDALPAGFGG